MTSSLMVDAFAHHVWATMRLIDVCLELPPEQLDTASPGRTLDPRHAASSRRLRCLVPALRHEDETFPIDEDHMDLRELRSAMERNGARWSQLLADELEPNTVIAQVDRDDGYQKDATVGIRFAQALHHGTDHRSQICTALTSLGVEPPPIDV